MDTIAIALISKKEQKNTILKAQIINLGKATELTWGASFKWSEGNGRRPLNSLERLGSQ